MSESFFKPQRDKNFNLRRTLAFKQFPFFKGMLFSFGRKELIQDVIKSIALIVIEVNFKI